MRWLRNKIIHKLTEHLLRPISPEDVLKPNKKGDIMYRGRVLTGEEEHAIANEAHALSHSRALKLILTDMEYLAQQTMFEKSKNYDEMLFGKAMLYNVDLIRKKIANLETISRPK